MRISIEQGSISSTCDKLKNTNVDRWISYDLK